MVAVRLPVSMSVLRNCYYLWMFYFIFHSRSFIEWFVRFSPVRNFCCSWRLKTFHARRWLQTYTVSWKTRIHRHICSIRSLTHFCFSQRSVSIVVRTVILTLNRVQSCWTIRNTRAGPRLPPASNCLSRVCPAPGLLITTCIYTLWTYPAPHRSVRSVNRSFLMPRG